MEARENIPSSFTQRPGESGEQGKEGERRRSERAKEYLPEIPRTSQRTSKLPLGRTTHLRGLRRKQTTRTNTLQPQSSTGPQELPAASPDLSRRPREAGVLLLVLAS